MAGTTQTPGAVNATHISTIQQTVLMGPLSSFFGVASDFPLRNDGIKAIWRNEVGTAT